MKLKRILFLIAVLVLGPGVSAQAPSGAAVDLSQQVDELFSKQAKDSPGCAVAVISSGRILYKRGYGL